MSKRIIESLVSAKAVTGWDDPRLYTLVGLRRRGVPPGAILSFVNELGVTPSRTVIQTNRFEQSVRRYLEFSVPRLMLVLDPVPVVIAGLEALSTTELEVPFSPKDTSMGSHKLSLTKTVYIDRSDFQTTEDKNFFRLVPGGTVGLLYCSRPVRATSFTQDPDTGLVTEIQATLDIQAGKPKAFVQWVPEGSQKAEVRMLSRLFKSENPKAAEGGILNDLTTDSMTVYPSALIESGLHAVRQKAPWPPTPSEIAVTGPETVRFQGIRIGYFVSSTTFK